MVVGGPTITLSNGTKMPQVGLGTWQSKPEEVKAAVKTAVEAGYRLIDTATCYENESAIGDAIKELIQEGKVTREELFITTKLWLTHLHPDDTETGIREITWSPSARLRRPLPCTFSDHDMTEQNPSVTVQDIWRGLEGVYKKGLTKQRSVCRTGTENRSSVFSRPQSCNLNLIRFSFMSVGAIRFVVVQDLNFFVIQSCSSYVLCGLKH
ncbi:oxidoreductase, aldo/keto reductase family protein, partial [Ostertagia ostertagi]